MNSTKLGMTSKPSNSFCINASQASTSAAVEHLSGLDNQTIERDLSNVLEAVKILDVHCAFARCKRKTNLMGQNCEYCRERYCFRHGLPEIHGCGEAIRHDERKKFLHPEAVVTSRQREDLAKAKKRLHAKLTDMNLLRKQRQPTAGKSRKK